MVGPVQEAVRAPVLSPLIDVNRSFFMSQAANFQGPFGKMLAANPYSAYFWHPIFITEKEDLDGFSKK
jgi:hypothetical protein